MDDFSVRRVREEREGKTKKVIGAFDLTSH